jgi:hypothetical protein
MTETDLGTLFRSHRPLLKISLISDHLNR